MNQTLYSIFSTLPFALCLFWWIILLLRRGTVSSPAHRYLSIFALACMLLYFCHAAFFNGEETPVLRVLYFVCNLSVYPIFWLYVRSLTEPELPKIGAWWVMVPGPVASHDGFYGQGAYDGVPILRKLGVLCVEMEAYALYLNAALTGKHALAICTISDHTLTGESLSAEERQNSFIDMIRLGLSIA